MVTTSSPFPLCFKFWSVSSHLHDNFFYSSSHNTSLSHTFNWPPHDLQSQALNCTQSDFCLWTLRGTNGTPPGCDIRRQTGERKKKRRCVDSVQHKCRLSDLPLMRRHLRQGGRRKLLLWKTHRWACHARKKGWGWEGKILSCFLRADKETLKGIK